MILITHPSHRRYDAEWEIEWALEGLKFDVLESDYYGVLLVKINDQKLKDAYKKLKNFDTSSIFHVIPLNYIVESDISEIKNSVFDLCDEINETNSFAVRCKRRGDRFDSSKEIEKNIGAYVIDKTNASVDLDNPDYYISIEILGNKTGVGLSGERLRKNVK